MRELTTITDCGMEGIDFVVSEMGMPEDCTGGFLILGAWVNEDDLDEDGHPRIKRAVMITARASEQVPRELLGRILADGAKEWSEMVLATDSVFSLGEEVTQQLKDRKTIKKFLSS